MLLFLLFIRMLYVADLSVRYVWRQIKRLINRLIIVINLGRAT